MNIIRFCIERSLVMNLIVIFILLIGLMKTLSMQREAFPSIDFDVLTVRTGYPGASPREVEKYVTQPIERELKSVSGIKEASSVSIESLSVILIKLDPDLPDQRKRKVVDDIQRAVDRVSDLPDDLPERPIVNEANSGDRPVIEVALSGPVSYAELWEVAKGLVDRLEDIPDISKVSEKGLRDREYWVEVNPDDLERYHISLIQLLNILAARNINLPGGSIETENGELLIRTMSDVKTVEEIENIVVRTNDYGVTIYLKDIAKVSETFEKKKYDYRTNGNPSINLLVIKNEQGDIITLVDQVKEVTERYLDNIQAKNIRVDFINDISVFVRNRLGVLLNNGVFGFILVLISLLLMLSPSVAFVTAIGMPVAFLGAIAIMGYYGLTINLITMFALVIVLGMLVDDAIIVAENIWQHYEMGESPLQAAIKGTSEVFWPVTSTILTTIAAFSPLLMISGIFGKFIRHMPIVVIVALTCSLLEAMFVLPGHVMDAIKFRGFFRRKLGKTEGFKKDEKKNTPILDFYEWLFRKALRGRYLLVGFTLAVFGGSVYFAKRFIPLILFPSDGIESFFIQADLPITYSIEQTSKKFLELEKYVAQLPQEELHSFATVIGKQQHDPDDPFTNLGSHVGQIQVFLTPEIERQRDADAIIEDLRQRIEPQAKQLGFTRIVFERVRHGPPVGKPVAVRIKGENLDIVRQAARNIMEKLRSLEGVKDIAENYRPGKEEVLVYVDNKLAAASLLTSRDIAHTIRTAFEGEVASYIRDQDERIALRVKFPHEAATKIDHLQNLKMINAQGNIIALKDIARFETAEGINAIFHRDFKRTITVTAAIDENVTTSQRVNQTLMAFLTKVEKSFPGIIATAGGEWEDTNESLASLKQAFIYALFLIFLILANQFKSVLQPIVVMLAIPLGLIGVIWAFYVHHLPLSFLGLIGTIGLSGVVVNDSIVLVDFINEARRRGMETIEATIYAVRRRFRAVWLTSLTTILGLLPMVYGIGGMDKFLRPAAVALGYGLLFGTLLILFVVPAAYVILDDVMRVLRNPYEK